MRRRQPKTRKPIGFTQLCAIAKAILEANPAIDHFDWLEAIKWRIVKLEYTYPTDHEDLARATEQVERAFERMHGRRRPLPPYSPNADQPKENLKQGDPPWPRRRENSPGFASLRDLIATLRRS
jgi:hypothetical protein